jgi:hypothetical protein
VIPDAKLLNPKKMSRGNASAFMPSRLLVVNQQGEEDDWGQDVRIKRYPCIAGTIVAGSQHLLYVNYDIA